MHQPHPHNFINMKINIFFLQIINITVICKAQFHWVTFSYPIEQHVICIYKDVCSRFGRKITNGNRFQIRKNDTISIPIKNKSNEGVCSLYCRVQLGHQGRQHVIILIEKDGINCFLWESWIIIRHYMLHKYCTHTIQKIWLQTIYCSGYWILNWPPDGVNYEEVEDDEETERQKVDEDEKGRVVDVVQRLRPYSKHVNDGWRCFEAT